MERKVKINYAITNDTTLSVGEFEVETFDEIETALVDIVEIISARNTLEKITKITIQIEETKNLSKTNNHIEITKKK